ncbi:MAG: prolyl oligopeptidase family serine peptidase [Planctomycetota bacterium]|nr:prolyl oligopeptidase family serine peptidase [Planctomycetota bacterium]MDA1105464.1 prolyl oligopeptidase family serine peptidase [Planctomycetota bacterium]
MPASTLSWFVCVGILLGCQPSEHSAPTSVAAPAQRTNASASTPPTTRTEPVVDTYHGTSVSDPYRWLEALEQDSPEVKSWTDLQNEHTRTVLDSLPCREALTGELTTLMQLRGVGLPKMAGELVFFTERTGTQNQPVLKVVKAGEDPKTAARVLIDPNALSEAGLISLDWWEPTKDGSLLAYGTSQSGSELSELRILRVDTGDALPDVITGKASFGGWNPDKRAFVYSGLRDIKDPYSRESRWHVLGQDAAGDRVIVKQTEPSRIPWAGITDDGKWFLVGLSDGWQRNDLWIADAPAWIAGNELNRIPVAVGLDGRFEPQFSESGRFVMKTTFESPRGRLVSVAWGTPEQASWKTIVPEGSAVLDGAGRTKHAMLVSWEADVHSEVTIHSPEGQRTGSVHLPGIGTASVSTSDEHGNFFAFYTSYNSPRTILSYDGPKANPSVWAKTEVLADLSSIQVTQHFTPSKDGTKIPYFMVRWKDVTATGANPTLLYAYGGFNVSLTPAFQATMLPWLERGGISVVANLRGGSEYGEAWHRAGMQANKQNVFDDLYAVAGALVSDRWTDASHLAVEGGSNGGLLTGVAVTQRPELFACAISAVPLLDMLRFHQFLIAKYWVPEYGSSETPEGFRVLQAYSPYQNVTAGTPYPAVLFTAGENDSRVHPLHARKMAALMQAQATNGPDDPILLWVDRDAGHGAGKPLALRVRDEVDQWSFVMWQTGLCGER